jgi:putative tryptophan/tyrosine transport system substrate-binding protein
LIGYLSTGTEAATSYIFDIFSQRMQALGYQRGRHYEVIARYADNDYARLSFLAHEIVDAKPDVIFTAATVTTVALFASTKEIPIVSSALGDPIGNGFAESLAHPGRNVTGIVVRVETLPGKQLEIAREVVPSLKKVGMLINSKVPARITESIKKQADAAASGLGITLVELPVETPDDLPSVLQRAKEQRIELLIVYPDPMLVNARREMAALALATSMPTMFAFRESVDAGGLASYGYNLADGFRSAADFVDKILKGHKAGDLPLELPTKLEFVVNLKTAKALRLEIPPQLLARADEVIE